MPNLSYARTNLGVVYPNFGVENPNLGVDSPHCRYYNFLIKLMSEYVDNSQYFGNHKA